MNRLYACCMWLVLVPLFSSAQETLVPEAINDTFNLHCEACGFTVRDIYLFKGQQWEPLEVPAQGLVNMLLWRYYDRFMGKHALYHKQMLSEPSMLLLDEVDSLDRLSLHVVLEGQDSLGRHLMVMLLFAGLNKHQFTAGPTSGIFEEDNEAIGRFYAIARVLHADIEKKEEYHILDGQFDLLHFDPRKKEITGHFEIIGNCIGWQKRGWFNGGHFTNVKQE